MAMDLDRLDLNLLRVFEALMAERHVTRAAARLGLTQSAASNALGRLRAAFKDDLFQRTPAGMEPTALARELAGLVGAALDAVRSAVALNRPFDPARAEEDFTLGMSDYAEFVLAPPLIAALRARAPGVSIVVRHVDREVVTALLDEDRAHLAIGQFPEPPTRMTRIMLLRDELAVLMRPDHPAVKEGLGLEAFLTWPHLLVSAVASREGAVDRVLANLGRERRLAAVVSHYLAAAPILRGSDLLCTTARRIAIPLAEAFGLVLLPVPAALALGSQPTSLVFHNRYAQHPAHRWLRALITETARRLVASPVPEHNLPGSA
jgi:LysR family transcriptional activator of mexEF-oprN operon